MKSRKGSIFITVTFVLATLMIMLSLLLRISTTAVRTSQSFSEAQRAYYLARSGIETGIADIKLRLEGGENLDNIENGSGNMDSFNGYPPHNVSWSYFRIGPGTYRINSVASYNNGKYASSLEADVTVNLEGEFKINRLKQN